MNDETQNDSLEEFEEDVTEYIGKDEHSKSLALPQQMMPRRMYVLPVSNRPFFPAQVQPVVVNQNPWQETLKRVGETDHKVMGICFVEEEDAEAGVPASEQLVSPRQHGWLACPPKLCLPSPSFEAFRMQTIPLALVAGLLISPPSKATRAQSRANESMRGTSQVACIRV